MIHTYKPPPMLASPPDPSSHSSASTPSRHPSSIYRSIYDDWDPASAIEAAFASATLLTSPCLPFCPEDSSVNLSRDPIPSPLTIVTHVPLGESQLHLSSSLSCQSLVVFQASADDSCGDRQVFVVAVGRIVRSSSWREYAPN